MQQSIIKNNIHKQNKHNNRIPHEDGSITVLGSCGGGSNSIQSVSAAVIKKQQIDQPLMEIATTSPIKMRKQRRPAAHHNVVSSVPTTTNKHHQSPPSPHHQSKKRKESPVLSRKQNHQHGGGAAENLSNHSKKERSSARVGTPPKKMKRHEPQPPTVDDFHPLPNIGGEAEEEQVKSDKVRRRHHHHPHHKKQLKKPVTSEKEPADPTPPQLIFTRDMVIVTEGCFPKFYLIQQQPTEPTKVMHHHSGGKRPESIQEQHLATELSLWLKFWSKTLAVPIRKHLLESAKLVFMPQHIDLFIPSTNSGVGDNPFEEAEESAARLTIQQDDSWVVFLVSFVPLMDEEDTTTPPRIVLTTPLENTPQIVFSSPYYTEAAAEEEPLCIIADSPLDLILKLGRELETNPSRCPNEYQRQLIRETCQERSVTTVWSMFRMWFPSTAAGGGLQHNSDDADHLSLEFSMDQDESTTLVASGPPQQSAVNLCGGTLEDLRVFFRLVNSTTTDIVSDLSAAQQVNKARAILLMSIDEATRRSEAALASATTWSASDDDYNTMMSINVDADQGQGTSQQSLSQTELVGGSALSSSRVVFNISGTRLFLDQVPENTDDLLDEASMDVAHSLCDSGIISMRAMGPNEL